jgi:hypothetical protein
VHLEAVFEHSSDSESDERVIVDHKAVWALAQRGFRSLVLRFGYGQVRRAPMHPILAQRGLVR